MEKDVIKIGFAVLIGIVLFSVLGLNVFVLAQEPGSELGVRLIQLNDSFDLRYNEADYTIYVLDIVDGFVDIGIMPGSIRVEIGNGKFEEVDLDGDGNKDVSMTIQRIDGDLVDIDIKSIQSGKLDRKSAWVMYLIIAAFIVFLIIIVAITLLINWKYKV